MNLSELARKKCVPCKGGTKPVSRDEAATYLGELKGWSASDDGKQISREFLFDTFANAMIFVNCVAHLSDEEGHHPDMYIFYNKVRITLYTHAIGGLSVNDFIIAAKITEDCAN